MPNETWVAKDIPIPGDGNSTALLISGRCGATRIRVQRIAGPGSFTYTGDKLISIRKLQKLSDKDSSVPVLTVGIEALDLESPGPHIQIDRVTPMPGERLILWAVDDHGRR